MSPGSFGRKVGASDADVAAEIRPPMTSPPLSPPLDALAGRSDRAPTRRGVLAAAAGLLGGAAGVGPARAVPAIILPRMRSEFATFAELPIVRPQHVPTDPGLLFFVQHSINDNVIVYARHHLADGSLDPDDPIEVFWRRNATKGHRRELSFFERMFAFGVATSRRTDGSFDVRLVSLPGREGRFAPGPDGAFRLLLDIDGRPMRPVYVYAEAEAGSFIPTLRHVDLYAVADGEKGYVRERVVFG